MVALIEHAGDATAPAEDAWLMSGSVAVCLVALIATARTLVDDERLAGVYAPVMRAMAIAAAVALLVGAWRPAPWLLALSLAGILLGLWLFAVDRLLRTELGQAGEAAATGDPEARAAG
jgi:hypothetical protein